MHPCLAVWKIKGRMWMRRRVGRRDARYPLADFFLSQWADAGDTRPWEAEFGKGLTSDSWPAECILYQSAMRQTEEQVEEGEEMTKRVSWLLVGLKRSVDVAVETVRRQKERKREGMLCSHLAHSVIQNIDTGSWRWGKEEGLSILQLQYVFKQRGLFVWLKNF